VLIEVRARLCRCCYMNGVTERFCKHVFRVLPSPACLVDADEAQASAPLQEPR
jgi:hypothetical protein